MLAAVVVLPSDHDLLLLVYLLLCVRVSLVRLLVIYCILFGAFDNCLKKILRIRKRFATRTVSLA